MNSSIKRKVNLLAEIKFLSTSDEKSESNESKYNELSKKLDELNKVDKLHQTIQTKPQVLFDNIYWHFSNYSKTDFLPILRVFNKVLAEIKNKNISALLPENYTTNIEWQYRYALTLGFLSDWKNYLEDKPILFHFYHDISRYLITTEEDVLTLLPYKLANKNLYKEAINQNILSSDKCEIEYQSILLVKTNQKKNEDEFNTLVSNLRNELIAFQAIYINESLPDNELYFHGNNLIQSIISNIKKNDANIVSVNPINMNSELREALISSKLMIENLRKLIDPKEDLVNKPLHFQAVNDHAVKIIALSDENDRQTKDPLWHTLAHLALAGLFIAGFVALIATPITPLTIYAFAMLTSILALAALAPLPTSVTTIHDRMHGIFTKAKDFSKATISEVEKQRLSFIR